MAASNNPYPFTGEFQAVTVARLLSDPVLLTRVASFIEPARFSREEAALSVDHMVRYYCAHQAVPTSVELLQSIRSVVDTGKLAADSVTRCALFFEEGNELPQADGDFVLDQIAKEARKRAMWCAIEDSIKTYQMGHYDEIVCDITKAAQVGKVDLAPGTNFAANLDARTIQRKTGASKPRWGTGICDLDDVLRGGLAAGELGMICGGPKSGKSTFMGDVAKHTMALGGTPVYVTLEMSEEAIVERLDASISGVLIDQLPNKADYVDTCVRDYIANTQSAFSVKYMHPNVTTVAMIASYLRFLRAEYSIKPTALLVDYCDLLASSNREEKRFDALGTITMELRALAVDWECPVWTGSQATRSAIGAKVVGMGHTGESYKKVANVDLEVTICATEEELQDGITRFNVAACRFAPSNVTVGPYRTGFAMGRMIVDGRKIQ